jgi:hypothetical protein
MTTKKHLVVCELEIIPCGASKNAHNLVTRKVEEVTCARCKRTYEFKISEVLSKKTR